jgi:septal ring factor EnvC (AmiA/AmiB activator)
MNCPKCGSSNVRKCIYYTHHETQNITKCDDCGGYFNDWQQSEISSLKAENEQLENVNSQLWESLRGIKRFITEKDYERALLWISDTFSGFKNENIESTLAKQSDQINILRDENEHLKQQLASCAESTHRQAICINQCAAEIGNDASATIDGLPLAVRNLKQQLASMLALLDEIEHHPHCEEGCFHTLITEWRKNQCE